MKKILIKLFVLLVLITVAITNISNAASLTNERLKNSLKKIFLNSVTIEVTQYSDDGQSQGTSTLSYEKPDQLIVEDSVVKIKSVEEGKEIVFELKYSVVDNKCTFDLEVDSKTLGMEDTNDPAAQAVLGFAFSVFQNQVMNTAYIAVADALDMNIDAASSYFAQAGLGNGGENQLATTTTNIDCAAFKFSSEYDAQNFKSKGHLEINVDEFSKINESSLNGKVKSKVTLGGDSSNSGNTTANKITTITPITNKTNTTNQTTNTANMVVRTNTANKIDNTTVSNQMPQTGDGFLSYIILGLIVVSLVMYIKIRKIDSDK